MQLDGERTADKIRAAFAEQFDEPLSEGDLDELIELARGQDLLQPAGTGDLRTAPGQAAPKTAAYRDNFRRLRQETSRERGRNR